MVWKQNDSYSTFARLCQLHKQHGSLLLFQTNASRFLGATFVNGWGQLRLDTCSWWAPMNETKKTWETKCVPEQKHLDLEASSRAWHCCNCEHKYSMQPPKVGIANGNPWSVKCKRQIREYFVPQNFGAKWNVVYRASYICVQWNELTSLRWYHGDYKVNDNDQPERLFIFGGAHPLDATWNFST